MSRLKNEITATLLQQPNLLRDYPWYPTAYLALAHADNNLQKLAAFVNHPLRVHLLVSDDEMAEVESIFTEMPVEPSETHIEEETEINSELVSPDEANAKEEEVVALENYEEEAAAETVAPTAAVPEEKPIVLPRISITPATNESFLFQPFHTVDYFASLGIKADQLQIETTTRFDTQLKSFSQWLKVMKRADYKTGQFVADPAVEAQAKASLEAKEVVTEAMADVLAQQGRHAHAIELYHKLTLLHPEKSAFFAAQIEKLKA